MLKLLLSVALSVLALSSNAQPIDPGLEYIGSTSKHALYHVKGYEFDVYTNRNGIQLVSTIVLMFSHDQRHVFVENDFRTTSYTSREACLRGRGAVESNIALKIDGEWKVYVEEKDLIRGTWDSTGFRLIDILMTKVCQLAVESGKLY